MNRFFFVLFGTFCAVSNLSVYGSNDVVSTKKGETTFFSKSAGPAQDIHAVDNTGEASLQTASGKVEVRIQMKNFSLPKSLMQKHYNERYMHTDRFPYATFAGKIENWKKPEKDGTIPVTVSGDFTIHGVTKKRQITGKVTKKGDTYKLEGDFEVKLEDHDIPIPVLFFTKITESVAVTVNYELSP